MDLTTTRRHLLSAVRALSAEAGTIDMRVRAAYEVGLKLIARNPGVPEHLRADFDALIVGCEALIRQEHVDEMLASRLAKQTVILYERVVKEST